MTDKPRFYSVYADDPMYVHLVKERDELRVENERLRAEVADLLPGMDADAMTISNLARENERLRAALEKHHDLLSDEPGDVCRTCALDYLGRDTE